MARDYSTLMSAADELEKFAGFLTTEDLNAQAKVQQVFNSARDLFVYDALKSGEDAESVKESIAAELSEMENLQPGWGGTYAYVREELLGRIDSESKKSPAFRKVVRWTPAALGVAAVIAYFSVRIFSGVDINQPIETKAGLVQRASAFERVLTHAEMEPTGYGTRSAIKAILRWPIEPSEAEIAGAQEFVSVVLGGHAKLSQESAVCGGLIGATTSNVSEQEVELVKAVAEYIQQADVKWLNPPIMTVLEPIKAEFPCR